jgi:hypothetical protein
LGNLKARGHLGDIGVVARIIFKWITNKECVYVDWVLLSHDGAQWWALVDMFHERRGSSSPAERQSTV